MHLNGFGLHTTLGKGIDANVDALMRAPLPPQAVLIRYGGQEKEVPYYLLADAADEPEVRFDRALRGVIDEALERAGLTQWERRSMGLFIGSSCGEIPIIETQYRYNLAAADDSIPQLQTSGLGNLANRLREEFGIRGPDFSFYTACTASANALLAAVSMVRAGSLQHALVVTIEASNTITALGFSGLQLVAHDVMRPFDRQRAGLVPGEGAAAVVVSASPGEGRWEVLGGAQLCDTHSISATNPDGSKIVEVIERCGRSCGISLAEIDALKLHGTASLLNDEAEAAAVKAAFDEAPSLCALKPFIGHTYGACGLIELALFCGSVERGRLPATPGICAGDSDLDIVLNQRADPQPPGKFMLNYCGFGGSNTSMIVCNDA